MRVQVESDGTSLGTKVYVINKKGKKKGVLNLVKSILWKIDAYQNTPTEVLITFVNTHVLVTGKGKKIIGKTPDGFATIIHAEDITKNDINSEKDIKKVKSGIVVCPAISEKDNKFLGIVLELPSGHKITFDKKSLLELCDKYYSFAEEAGESHRVLN